MSNIALIGFMGCGKTTVSEYLGNYYGYALADTDAMIVEQQGMAIKDIFAEKGEPYFRSCESDVVIQLQQKDGIVISCGGGLVMREENVVNLKKGSKIVLLTATPQTIYNRVHTSTDRPLLNGHMNVEYIAELMEKRRPKYEAAADIVVATDGKSVAEICKEIVAAVK